MESQVRESYQVPSLLARSPNFLLGDPSTSVPMQQNTASIGRLQALDSYLGRVQAEIRVAVQIQI